MENSIFSQSMGLLYLLHKCAVALMSVLDYFFANVIFTRSSVYVKYDDYVITVSRAGSLTDCRNG
jgi:hypothetical protein